MEPASITVAKAVHSQYMVEVNQYPKNPAEADNKKWHPSDNKITHHLNPLIMQFAPYDPPDDRPTSSYLYDL